MCESGSVLRYLASSIESLHSLYPSDPSQRHAVDSQLDNFATAFWVKLEKHYLKTKVGPAYGHLKLPRPKIQQQLFEETNLALRILESHLTHKFVALETFTIADIQFFFGIQIVNTITDLNLSQYHKVHAWYQNCIS